MKVNNIKNSYLQYFADKLDISFLLIFCDKNCNNSSGYILKKDNVIERSKRFNQLRSRSDMYNFCGKEILINAPGNAKTIIFNLGHFGFSINVFRIHSLNDNQ